MLPFRLTNPGSFNLENLTRQPNKLTKLKFSKLGRVKLGHLRVARLARRVAKSELSDHWAVVIRVRPLGVGWVRFFRVKIKDIRLWFCGRYLVGLGFSFEVG